MTNSESGGFTSSLSSLATKQKACIICLSSLFSNTGTQRQEEHSESVTTLCGSCAAGVGAGFLYSRGGKHKMSLEEGQAVEVINRSMPDSSAYRKDALCPCGFKHSESIGSKSCLLHSENLDFPARGCQGHPCCVFGCLITDSRAWEELRTHPDPSRAREKGANSSQWQPPEWGRNMLCAKGSGQHLVCRLVSWF